VPADRRHRRRRQTIEEILDVAVAVMAEEGAGGLSLGEVARRMGIRTPSLYVYFDSKNALYDAIFARGWTGILDAMNAHAASLAEVADPRAAALTIAEDFVRWAVTNAPYAQLMFWRPVPGFEPSSQAYAAASEVLQRARELFAQLKDRGLLRADIDLAAALTAWTVLVSGVISQQLSNAPGDGFENGSFTRLLPDLMSMYFAYYGPEGRPDDSAGRSPASTRDSTTRPQARGTHRDESKRRDAGPAAKPRRR